MEPILNYKTLFFNIVTTINYAFSPAMNYSLHAALLTICTSGGNPLLLSSVMKCTTHCLTALTFTVWSLYTFSKCWWMSVGAIFSTWRNSVPHLCFIRTSTPDAILSDCPSAAVWHTATKWNGKLVGRFSLYCHPTNIHLWCYEPKKWNRTHYFWSSHSISPIWDAVRSFYLAIYM